MAYLVDSNWIIEHQNGVPAAVALLRRLGRQGISISIITYMELYQGILRSQRPAEAEARLRTLLETIPILPLSQAVAERCAQLRETLRRAGRRVDGRALDLIIAATAIEYHLTLVTRNVDDFRDVPGLKLYRFQERRR